METLIYDSMVEKTISLDPSELDDLNNYILCKLNQSLFSWDETLNGIVLSYRKVKVLKNALGSIGLGDYVYYRVRYIATYFRPEKGKMCMGKITNISESSLILLVLDLINTVIRTVSRVIFSFGHRGRSG